MASMERLNIAAAAIKAIMPEAPALAPTACPMSMLMASNCVTANTLVRLSAAPNVLQIEYPPIGLHRFNA